MAKSKKIDNDKFLISDSISGEPLGVSQKTGSGKHAEFETKLHTHVHQMYPEAGHILSRLPVANSIDAAAYQTEQMVDKLASGHKHPVDIVKDPEQVDFKDPYGDMKKHDLYHIHDRETGEKLLTLRHEYTKQSNMLGKGDKYYDSLHFHGVGIGTKDNVITALKKEGSSATPGLKSWANIAVHLKKIVSSGGPRFIGHQTTSGDTAVRRSYKSSIEDPKSAIDAYVTSGAIPNHEKLTKTVITPNMQLVHDDDEQHVVKFKDGHIHHTIAKVPSHKETKSLPHIIEEVE